MATNNYKESETKNKLKWTIGFKFSFIFGASLVVLVILLIWSLNILKANLMTDRQEKTKNLVDSIHSIAAKYNEMVKEEKMTLKEAQDKVIELIKIMRYDGDNYFWINGYNCMMIIHPTNPDLIGKDMTDMKDADGKRYFSEMLAVVKSNKEGFVDYKWVKANEKDPSPKISFVKGFEPWGWIIGTGIYVDDVDKIFWKEASKFGIIAVIVFIILIIIFYILLTKIKNGINMIVHTAEQVSQGNLNQDEIKINTSDEILLIGDGFNKVLASFKNIAADIEKLNDNALAGNLSYRADITKHFGDYQALVNGVNAILDTVITPLNVYTTTKK